MKKLLDYMKKESYYLLTIISAVIVITIIYILNKVSPFGENSLLKVDFYHQYGPMLIELYYRILKGNSLIYSFNVGLGIPLFRNFFNYLSSPINIIILFFNHKHLLTSFSFIIGIKAILSCITCSYYIKKKFNTSNLYMIGISILYAFSAYFTAYYWNIMWIDGMYVLPLITLGIENIINKDNGLLYTISLIYMLFTNYFIGYMICIYSCIYFVSYLIIKTDKINVKNILKKCIKFGICSLISGLILAFELIPMYEALTTTNATMGSVPTNQYYSFTIINFFKNHLTGINSTVFASDISNAPNVSCGILSITLFFLFIINNKISIKRKIILSFLLILFITSFYVAPLDYVWHAFHVPNDLPYRYSFMYSFILITISAYALNKIKETSIIRIIIAYILSILFIVYVHITKYNNIDNNMLICNYLIITTYFLIYLLYRFYPKIKTFISVLFITVCILEAVITVNHNWNISQSIDTFYSDYNDINTALQTIKKHDDSLFYRVEKNENQTLNDPAWYDYYGQETFSSMAYNGLSKLNYDLGMPGNEINSYYYKQNTPIYDTMFNIKYMIGKNKDDKRYSLFTNENGTLVYKYKYTTGLMYGVNDNIQDWNNNYINPVEYQNDFILNATNIENLFHRLTLKKKETIINTKKETIVKYTYNNELDNIYAYSNNSSINYIIINNNLYYKENVSISDISLKLNIEIKEYHSYDEPYIINDYKENNDIEVYVSYKNYLSEEIDIYTIDNDKFISVYDTLKSNEIKLTSFKENYIKGKIEVDKNMFIYTGIPYDKGWDVYVNNKKVNTYIVNDALLGFNINKGKNIIKLKYTPNDLDIGICISLTTLIISITYLTIKRKRTNNN